MNLSVFTESLSPFEIAERQLDRAISLFMNDNDFVCSLTLAGAAEEILGSLLKSAGEKTCLDLKIEFDLRSQDREVPEEELRGAQSALASLRNHYRNRLKHVSDGIHASTDCLAAEMLDRACYNYNKFSGKETEAMRAFRELILGGKYYDSPASLRFGKA